jgi:hypothetical protein
MPFMRPCNARRAPREVCDRTGSQRSRVQPVGPLKKREEVFGPLRRSFAASKSSFHFHWRCRVKTLLCAALIAMVPGAAFADDVVAVPATPAVDQPVAKEALLPKEAPQAEPQQAVQDAQRCGMHGCCAGRAHRGGGLIIAGVAGTVLTAVAIGVAVGIAKANQNQNQALQR